LNPIITTYRGHRIGSRLKLDGVQLEQLTELLEAPQLNSPSKLAGRAPICRGEIDGVGRVAVKTYCRGGLIKRVSRYHYLRTGKPRCRREFDMLIRVRGSGINAPEPIAFAYRGRVAYRGWLMTRELEGPRSLVDVCEENTRLCRKSIAAVAEQIHGLIENRIRHVDLHPGNVIVDRQNLTYLIDFDRAQTGTWNKKELESHYIARWSRAIDKHKLPALLRKELESNLSTTPHRR